MTEVAGWYWMFTKKMVSIVALIVSAVLAAQTLAKPPSAAEATTQKASDSLPAPKGLVPCLPDDPVAALEKRIAPSLAVEFVSCFRSTASDEYALVHRVPGDNFTPADVEALRTKVAAQWKGFQPLSAEFHDKYIARLNELLTGSGSATAPIASIKPVLISMQTLDQKSYSVVSMRSYVFNDSKGRESAEKISAAAIVLRGRKMMRLTIQRKFTAVSDVANLQADIAQWAKAME